MAAVSVKKSVIIKWIITFLIPICLWMIPTSEMFTSQLRLWLVLTMFAILMLALELMHNTWIAIFLPVAWVLTGVTDIATAFSPWTTLPIWMVVGSFIFVDVLDEIGLMKRLAYWFVSRCKGNFNKIMWFSYIAGLIIAYLTFGNGWMITFMLGLAICKVFDIMHKRAAAVVVLVAQLAGLYSTTHVYDPLNWANFAGAIQNYTSFADAWYYVPIYGLPCLLIGVITIFVALKVYKTKNITSEHAAGFFMEQYQQLGPMSIQKKKGAVITALLFIYLLTSSLHKQKAEYGFLVAPLLMFIPGINVAKKEVLNKTKYGMIVYMASMIAIGSVGAALGIGPLITKYLYPILSTIPTFFVPASVFVFGTLVNLLMTPGAMFAMFPPILAQLASDLGFSNPYALMLPMYYTREMCFLPYEQTLTMILFSLDMVSTKQYFKVSCLKIIVFFILFFVLMMPWWLLLGVL